MRLTVPALVAALGTTGCVSTVTSDSGLCMGLQRSVRALETALLANPQTPDAVGEAGADVVIGFDGGCRVRS
jgi:hypothetical protein